MVENNGGLCKRKNLCSMAAYCVRVHPKIQEELKEKNKPTAIDIEKFKAKGRGANCTLS